MKTLVNVIFLLCGLFLLGCQDELANSKRIDFNMFSLEVPQYWKKFTAAGYDSYVGGVTNGRDTLHYDYGWYAYDFRHETSATHTRTDTAIDGRKALIVQPNKKGKAQIGMFVQVDSLNKLSIYGRSSDEATVLRIFNSVTFE